VELGSDSMPHRGKGTAGQCADRSSKKYKTSKETSGEHSKC